MKNQTKIILGVTVIGVAYLIYKNRSSVPSISWKLNASGSQPCVFMDGSELVEGKISSYDPNMCVSSAGKKGKTYSEHNLEWKYSADGTEQDLELAKELQNKTKVQQRLVKKSPTVDSALFNREREQIFSEEAKIAQLEAINKLIR